MRKIAVLFIVFIQTACASNTYYYQNNNQKYLTPTVNSISRGNSKVSYYLTDKNQLLGVSDMLIIKLNDEVNIWMNLT